MKGRQGPSPLLYRCRKCGGRLEEPAKAQVAVCATCNTKRRAAILSGPGGLTVFFDGPDETANPIKFPSDGAYGLT